MLILLQQWNERYSWMSARNDEYYLLCITDDSSKIVGTGALLVERKFIHNLGLVGHIEDIAVAKDQQGKKLGLRIIQALDFVAEKVGCYKVCPPICMSFPGTQAHIYGTVTDMCYRPSSTAPKPTRDSTSSAGSRERDWRWRITTDKTSPKEVSRRAVCA
jgi:GNAT superfamily N-acetyltransferase